MATIADALPGKMLPIMHTPYVMVALLVPTALELGITFQAHLFACNTGHLTPQVAAISFSAKAIQVLKLYSLNCLAALKPVRAGIIL